ncbi:MAG: hypothetical protein LAO04_18870 [Acidobacteriia bacterium]|nr:hypothetical protein [Terriglobia bacterium]
MTDREGGKSVMIQVMRDGMGVADPALLHTLLRKYLQLLLENNTLPGAICFFGSGVKMVVEGSPVLDLLQSASPLPWSLCANSRLGTCRERGRGGPR